MHASRIASTGDQLAREHREEQLSRERQANNEAQLRAAGRETGTAGGRAVFEATAASVAEELTQVLAENLADPQPGVGHAALDLVALLSNPTVAAVVALRVVVDRISAARPYVALAMRIGDALEQEVKGQGLARSAPLLVASVQRRYPQRTVLRNRVARRLAPEAAQEHEPWSAQAKAQAGALMLGIMETVGLIETSIATAGNKRPRVVVPTTAVINLASEVTDQFWTPSRGPMVVPPRPWRGLSGGGHLSGGSLVRDRSCTGSDIRARFDAAATTRFTEIANVQQGVRLWIDPEMVAFVQQAWDAGGLGLFRAGREPQPIPPRPPGDAEPAVWAAWRRAAAAHHADLRINAGRRARIARGLRELGELAGREVWQAHWFDGRGRLYCRNRHASTQGQDFEKACIGFAWDVRPGPEVRDVLVNEAMARGGRWSLEALRAVVLGKNPLDCASLISAAKDPWQFLQAARALRAYQNGEKVPNVPIRLDQTCSGCGIIAAITGDTWLAEQTNVIGNQRKDLYGELARLLVERLEMVLHSSRPGTRDFQRAQRFLSLGIDRTTVKPVVIAIPYGGQRLGAVEVFEDWLTAKCGWQDPATYVDTVSRPAAWLARQFDVVIKERMTSALAFRRWARDLVRAVIPVTQQPIRWKGPSGWPMFLGSTRRSEVVVRTEFHGVARLMTLHEENPERELSALATANSASANIVHGLDAAVVHLMVRQFGRPMLTNHDCFAVEWHERDRLHATLLDTFRNVTTRAVPEMLAQIEEQCRGAGPRFKGLPPFPMAENPWPAKDARPNPAMYG